MALRLEPDTEWDMSDFSMNSIATTSVENDMDGAMRSDRPASNQENVRNYFNQPTQHDPVSNCHAVGLYKELSENCANHIENRNPMQANNDSDDLPNILEFEPVNLEREPGYRFRLAAINAMGSSDWGATSTFMTRFSGLPGAPTSIEISNSVKGAQVKWNPPPTPIADPVTEYSLHIAMEPKPNEDHAYAGNKNMFLRVYVGPANECVLTASLLASAYRNDCFQPFILRIAGRNGSGYGPAVQVRWLPDPPKKATIPMSTIMEDDEVTTFHVSRKRPSASDACCEIIPPFQIKKSK